MGGLRDRGASANSGRGGSPHRRRLLPPLGGGRADRTVTVEPPDEAAMRIESSVTSLSWIPSEAIKGMTKLPFERGVTHYDKPPPDVIDDLEALRRADRFRFANVLRAWIEVEDGRVVGHGYTGGGRMGSSTVRLGSKEVVFEAVPFPDLRRPPEVSPT